MYGSGILKASEVMGPLYAVLVDQSGCEVSARAPMADDHDITLLATKGVATRVIIRVAEDHVCMGWIQPCWAIGVGDSFTLGAVELTFA